MRIHFTLFAALVCCLSTNADDWSIQSAEEWRQHLESSEGAIVEDAGVSATEKTATVKTKLHASEEKRSAASLTITQSPIWQNWEAVENIGPKNMLDAPVFLVLGPNDYWLFGRLGTRRKKNEPKVALPPFTPEPATLEGFDMPLMTTRYPNQFEGPGAVGQAKSLRGYNAWQSRDMVNWVHHGPVTERFSGWVTSAEHIDGKTLIYYDYPNDQDPHVYIDEDLFDGKPGKNMGMAVKDPSHGSDAGFIRDLDGKVHCIIENWDPIDASKHSWDSPLASRFVSPNGIDHFVFSETPAVDERTEPTGKMATFRHPGWDKEDPDNYETGDAEYEVHSPEQDAYGDWAAICIGGRYYLFCDYDPKDRKELSVGWFTSSSIEDTFTWCDEIGVGHPDPDIGFAEGKFYLITQQQTDYTSPGPWVESVEARVGVDTDNDQAIDQWTDWAQVSESYDYIEGFSKQIAKTPASLDLSELPEGYAFQVELRLTDTTENKSKPIVESLTLSFSE